MQWKQLLKSLLTYLPLLLRWAGHVWRRHKERKAAVEILRTASPDERARVREDSFRD